MLTAKKVERTKKPGRYSDGLVKGLKLQIGAGGAKSWVLRFERHGREHMMGLGSASDLTLAQARERAKAARLQLLDGVDPLQTKRAAKAAAKAAAVRALTFREAAQRYFNTHESKWKSASHRDQFLSSLADYAFPVIGDMDVAAIQLPDVLRVIEPTWTSRTVTADRVRNRIENVLDWCMVRGHRPPGNNPAKWKGFLDQVLPAPRKVAPVKHFSAMDYAAVPAFMAELRQQNSIAAKALQFLILTAARRGEVLGATWDEINLGGAVWVVPGTRMGKTGKEHRVPLSPAALDLLQALPREDGNPFVFIGSRPGEPLGGLTLARLLKQQMGRAVTTHGFRSCFSDWAHEQTSHSGHTIEISLSHSVGNAVEQSYRRGAMFAKRVKLMADWAKYCCSPPAKAIAKGDNVTPISAGRR